MGGRVPVKKDESSVTFKSIVFKLPIPKSIVLASDWIAGFCFFGRDMIFRVDPMGTGWAGSSKATFVVETKLESGEFKAFPEPDGLNA
jgi:hypothetical protein